ncbi:MAG: YadA-like family protein [Phascolarctobacterium sp.]|nr:YadA-like family protein [Phascolarctobacterium sp.]
MAKKSLARKIMLSIFAGAVLFSNSIAWAAYSAGGGSTGESATDAVAIGNSATANGQYSTAVGTATQASGVLSTAIGVNAEASGEGSTAVGRYAQATDSSSIALGYYAKAQEISTVALGDSAMADGTYAIAIGRDAKASGLINSIAFGYSAEASYENSVALGANSHTSEANQVNIGYWGDLKFDSDGAITDYTQKYRTLAGVADVDYTDDTYGDYAVNVNTLNKALKGVGGLDSAVTKVEFSKTDEKLDGKLTVTTTADGTASSATVDLNEWADSKYATITNVQTVTGLSSLSADAVKTAYAGANDNKGTTYLKDATSLVDADIKLDAAIKDNATNIALKANSDDVYTKTESDSKYLSGASFKNNTITLDYGDTTKDAITLNDIASTADLEELKGNIDTSTDSKVTTLSTNVNKIIGVEDIATENALKTAYNKIGSSNTNYLANANTLVAADVALNNAISDINKNIGDLSSLNLGNDIATIISEVYKEAQAHTTVSAGNGVTVTGTTSGGSTETTDTNETTSTATGTGGTNYEVSANIESGDTNINVTLEDNKYKVSLSKDITVESVTSNEVTVNGENGSTVIDGDTVNTTTVNATTANIKEEIVVGTGETKTTISNKEVVTETINATNVTSNNVTVNNKFEVVGAEGKKTTIEGDTINSTTINLGDNVTVNNEGMTIEGGTTNVIINKDGITFEGDDDTANGPSINNNGMDMNNTTISNVKDGEVSATSKDAVNGSQLYQEATERMIADQKLNSRLNKVGAGAAALAALHPLDFDPDDKLSFSAGVGNYAGENAAALGMFYRPNEKVMLSMGGTMGNGENMVNMGISFALDKPNNVSNSRVAMAKEIVAMREHIAKQDAQIAQLVMLVNQLTGNVAQQEATPAFSPSGRVRVERLTDGYEEYDRVKIEKGAELDGDNSKTVEAK